MCNLLESRVGPRRCLAADASLPTGVPSYIMRPSVVGAVKRLATQTPHTVQNTTISEVTCALPRRAATLLSPLSLDLHIPTVARLGSYYQPTPIIEMPVKPLKFP